MSAQKLVTVFGALGKVEASYNDGATSLSATTDGVLLRDATTLKITHMVDGQRGPAPAGMGKIQRTKATTKIGQVALPIEARGLGTAYGASAFPPDVHALLRACGHVATLNGTAWEYTPQGWLGGAPTFASGAVDLYARGQLYGMRGVYGVASFEVEVGGMLLWSFDLQGLVPALPTDVGTLPTITYLGNTTPPKMETPAFSLGTFTSQVVRRVSFNGGREVSTRGIWGFQPGMREPTMEITVEAPALATSAPWHTSSTLNPWGLMDDGVALALSFTVGTVQYNRLTVTAPAAQVIDVTEEEDGAASLLRLTLQLSQSTPTTGDDYKITYD